MTLDYTTILKKIIPQPDGEDPTVLRSAVVSAVNSDGSLDILLSGTEIDNVPRLDSAVGLEVNDIVKLLTFRGGMLILDKVGGVNSGWVDYSPLLWSNMSTTRVSIARIVQLARYLILPGGLCQVQISVANNTASATTGGAGVQLPFTMLDTQPVIGSALITGSSGGGASTTQSGVAFTSGNDAVICIAPSTAFIDQNSGHYFRASIQYRI